MDGYFVCVFFIFDHSAKPKHHHDRDTVQTDRLPSNVGNETRMKTGDSSRFLRFLRFLLLAVFGCWQAEELGAQGEVEESMRMLEQVEDLKKKKSEAENEYRSSMPASSYQQQKLRVCEVCSAYLGIHDNDRRLADHFGGKLHLGKSAEALWSITAKNTD